MLDSVTGAPIVGARLAFRGTPVATESGERGAWRMEQLLPGEYIVEVRTPRLDSIGAVHVAPLLVTASTSDVEIRVGRPRPRYARFVGTVRDSSGGPIPEAAVSLADLNLSTYTDSAGRFELGQVPPGDHHVSVRRVGFGPVDVRVGFPAERVVERQVVLLSVQTLDVVTTTARSIIPGFDEHRAQGLGQFLTREDLERQSGRRLADVLAQFRGVRIATVNGRQHITARRRQEMAFNRNDVGRNDPRLVPVESQCPATIYINGALAYERRINTTPPNLADFTPDQIEAIEYYESETQVPVRYMRADARCGVLVIHTRRARQERAPAPKDKPGRR